MKETIKEIQEIIGGITEPTDTEKREHMDGLKPAINSLLYEYLPDHITIKNADILATVINEMVWYPEKFLTLREND